MIVKLMMLTAAYVGYRCRCCHYVASTVGSRLECSSEQLIIFHVEVVVFDTTAAAAIDAIAIVDNATITATV